jgi:hypothetical protein
MTLNDKRAILLAHAIELDSCLGQHFAGLPDY